jgi:L-histidine N-alpha-methyltransferase
MPSVARVSIHPSQFPGRLRQELLDCLRARQINHKFLYEGASQTQKWLALHQAYSPSRTDPECETAYDRSFAAAAGRLPGTSVHLVGLGCGGGQKDARLLTLLARAGKRIAYTPTDVSTAMVLVAREAALEVVGEEQCHPVVLDLSVAEDWSEVVAQTCAPEETRLFTFFGMLPNFEPDRVLPQFARALRQGDLALVSANLAPGADYHAGVKRVMPLYDNQLTRDWLLGFLLGLGVEEGDGQIRFTIEGAAPCPAPNQTVHSRGDLSPTSLARSTGFQPALHSACAAQCEIPGLERIAAYFDFTRARKLVVEQEAFSFSPGDSIRVFFSCRHTPSLLQTMLSPYGLTISEQWITPSQEEGVFLVKPA